MRKTKGFWLTEFSGQPPGGPDDRSLIAFRKRTGSQKDLTAEGL